MIRARFVAFFASALLLLAPLVRAQDNSFPPSPPPDLPVQPYRAIQPLRETLPNGLRVVIQENHRVPTVYMKMGIKAGLVTEPKETPMMSRMAVEMIELGSRKYDAEKRTKEAHSMGGEIDMSLDRDYVDFTAHCSSTFFNKMVDLMADELLDPKLDPDVFAYSIEVWKERVKRHQIPPPDPDEKKNYAYAERTPTLETLNNTHMDSLIEYIDDYYRPNNSIFVIVGDIDAAATMKQIKAAFGTWKSGPTPAPPKFEKEPPIPFYYIRLQDDPKAVESKITMFYNISLLDEKDKLPLQLANVILGESLNSRLYRSVREKYGYVYFIGSNVIFSAYSAQFQVSTQCRTAVTAKTIKQVQVEVDRLGKELVTDDELLEAKNYLSRKYGLALQYQSGTMEELFQIEFYKRPSDYFDRLRSQINLLKAQDVLQVAKKYMFPNGAGYISVVGAKEKIVDRLMRANVGTVLNPD